jgi:hypothetical protein
MDEERINNADYPDGLEVCLLKRLGIDATTPEYIAKRKAAKIRFREAALAKINRTWRVRFWRTARRIWNALRASDSSTQ